MFEDERLSKLIERRLANGLMPVLPPQSVHVRKSEGAICAACGAAIHPGATEIETAAEDGALRFYHPRCHVVAQLARARSFLTINPALILSARDSVTTRI